MDFPLSSLEPHQTSVSLEPRATVVSADPQLHATGSGDLGQPVSASAIAHYGSTPGHVPVMSRQVSVVDVKPF